jgi:hypothetical protein
MPSLSKVLLIGHVGKDLREPCGVVSTLVCGGTREYGLSVNRVSHRCMSGCSTQVFAHFAFPHFTEQSKSAHQVVLSTSVQMPLRLR